MQHPPPHPLPPITPRLNPVVCQNFYETGFLGATQWDHRNEKRLAEIRAEEHFCLFGMVDCKGTPPTKKKFPFEHCSNYLSPHPHFLDIKNLEFKLLVIWKKRPFLLTKK